MFRRNVLPPSSGPKISWQWLYGVTSQATGIIMWSTVEVSDPCLTVAAFRISVYSHFICRPPIRRREQTAKADTKFQGINQARVSCSNPPTATDSCHGLLHRINQQRLWTVKLFARRRLITVPWRMLARWKQISAFRSFLKHRFTLLPSSASEESVFQTCAVPVTTEVATVTFRAELTSS